MPRVVTLPAHPARPYQRDAWTALEDGIKRVMLIWHRRSGKDDVALGWTACSAVQRPASYWHMLPEYAQARKAIWTAVNPHSGKRRIDEHFPEAIRNHPREQTMEVPFKNGALWQVVGSDNYNSLVGATPAGVVGSEWALADPRAWAFLRPMLLESDGWAMFVTTPRGRNHAWRMYEEAKNDPNWFVQKLTVDDTGVFSQAQLDAELRELVRELGEDDGEAIFRQEYYCDFNAAIVGAYYSKEMLRAEHDGRIGDVPYDPGLPVWTAWDLGIGDSTAIWFAQISGASLRIIDYYEASGVGLDHYAKVLREKGYTYQSPHLMPHDAAHKDLTTGKERTVTLRQLGISARVLPASAVEDGIQAARRLIARCWFDKTKCRRGIDALQSYRREWDEDNKVFKKRPLHDWSSHGADAFRYLAMGLPDRMNLKPSSTPRDPYRPAREDDEWRTV